MTGTLINCDANLVKSIMNGAVRKQARSFGSVGRTAG
jgi:hypothetical protein